MRAIEQLAKRQYGLVTRAQLLAIDLSDAEIRGLIQRRHLVRIHRGVYRLVGAPTSFPLPVLATILRFGTGWASHGSAARVLHLPNAERFGRATVTLPDTAKGAARGVRLVRTRLVVPGQMQRVNDIPVTSLTRTICDLAGELSPGTLERLVDDCLVRRRVYLADLQATFETLDRPGRRGRAVLRQLLDERDRGAAVPESELERRFLALVDKVGLPRPQWQLRPPWLEKLRGRVDGMYDDARLVVEVDGRAWHLRDADRDRDLMRDHAAMLAGWEVLRLSWRLVTHQPAYVTEVVRGLLERRGSLALRPEVAA